MISNVPAVEVMVIHNFEMLSFCTVKLLQPYFGHLSCMPVVYVTCCKTSKDASNQNQSLSVVEKLVFG